MAFLPGNAKVGKLVGTCVIQPSAVTETDTDRKLLDKLHRCLPSAQLLLGCSQLRRAHKESHNERHPPDELLLG